MDGAPDFFAPNLRPGLVDQIQCTAPILARWLFQFKLEISPQHLERLQRIDSQRLLLLPNHPTFHDPIVMFVLSGRLYYPCHFMAALETFINPSVMLSISGMLSPLEGITRTPWFTRLFRRCLQSLGMYSVQRGYPDRSSVAATLKLLREPHCHLVIFPEGGCSFQNDTVMPFRTGGIQLALQALNRFAKQGLDIPDLYAVPIAIKYQYTRNMDRVIHDSLSRLEAALSLPSNHQSSDYERLRGVGAAVLNQLEQTYGLVATSEEPPWTQRVQALRQHVLETLEKSLQLEPADTYLRERVYRIQKSLQPPLQIGSNLQADRDRIEPSEAIERSTRRLLNFDAIYDGYVAALPTPERFLDTLIRLEREVFDIDQPPPKGFRSARILIGDPINLKHHFDDFRRDRSGTVAQITQQIQAAVQLSLDQFNQEVDQGGSPQVHR